jgi:hypothetical protein
MQTSLSKIHRKSRNQKRYFIIGFILSISPVIFAFFGNQLEKYALSMPFIILGLTAIVFPVATPETYDSFSMKNATLAMRMIGVTVCIIGIALLILL